jgi:hypothetical protein
MMGVLQSRASGVNSALNRPEFVIKWKRCGCWCYCSPIVVFWYFKISSFGGKGRQSRRTPSGHTTPSLQSKQSRALQQHVDSTTFSHYSSVHAVDPTC